MIRERELKPHAVVAVSGEMCSLDMWWQLYLFFLVLRCCLVRSWLGVNHILVYLFSFSILFCSFFVISAVALVSVWILLYQTSSFSGEYPGLGLLDSVLTYLQDNHVSRESRGVCMLSCLHLFSVPSNKDNSLFQPKRRNRGIPASTSFVHTLLQKRTFSSLTALQMHKQIYRYWAALFIFLLLVTATQQRWLSIFSQTQEQPPSTLNPQRPFCSHTPYHNILYWDLLLNDFYMPSLPFKRHTLCLTRTSLWLRGFFFTHSTDFFSEYAQAKTQQQHPGVIYMDEFLTALWYLVERVNLVLH